MSRANAENLFPLRDFQPYTLEPWHRDRKVLMRLRAAFLSFLFTSVVEQPYAIIAAGHAAGYVLKYAGTALALLKSGHLGQMCQVFGGELGLIYPCVDLRVDVVEGAFERGINAAQRRKRSS